MHTPIPADPKARMAITGFMLGLLSAFTWLIYFLPPYFPNYYTPIASYFPYLYFGANSVLIIVALTFSRLGLKSSTRRGLAVIGLVLTLLALSFFATVSYLYFFNFDL